jgi:23S rRNA pseudouridine2605 synthase
MKKNTQNSYSLTKFLSQAGVCARRKAVDLIKAGQISVNDMITKEPGVQVTQDDTVRMNGKVVSFEEPVYIIMNKPEGVITSVSDDHSRPTVMHVLGKHVHQRVYPVGRLDRPTTGVLLLTNDGELAQRLMHPKFGTEKVYQAELHRSLEPFDIRRVKQGVKLADGVAAVDKLQFISGKSRRQVLITLHSGKYRVVRRLFAQLGYTVKKLDRISFAGLTKKNLLPGAWRYMNKKEIENLKRCNVEQCC